MELGKDILTLPKYKIAVSTILAMMLLMAFVFVSPVVAEEQTQSPSTTFQNITVDVAHHMITSGDFPDLVILDVRNQSEYDMGHLYNAVLIRYDELDKRIDELQGHENHEIIVYCKAGSRSQIACEILAGHNFTKVYNMLGGILAWMDAGYPIWTTFHHVTVNIVEEEILLQIKPLLLLGAGCGCGSCTGNQGCLGCNERQNIQYTVLEEDENHTVFLLTYEVKDTTVEVTIANTLLWSYNVLTDGINRTASFISTEITAEDASTEFYSLTYLVHSAEYNLTLYTALTPLNSETYNSSYTFINYVPAEKSQVTSLETVEFNSSVTLSQHYAILGKVAKEMGKVYEESGDETLAQLAKGYCNMTMESKYLSKLVEKQLQIYNWNVLSSSATLMDSVCMDECNLISGLWRAAICGGLCALLFATVIGFVLCVGGCLAAWSLFTTWICNLLCGETATIQQYGCGVACAEICYLCPEGNPVCYVCGHACGLICRDIWNWLSNLPSPTTSSFPAGNQIYVTSGTLSSSGATYTFSVSSLMGTYTVVMVGNEQADFDLYAKWNAAPTTSNYDAGGFSIYSSEYFTVTGSGTLYVMVRSWYGNGNFRCNVVTGSPAAVSGRIVGTLSGGGSSATYSLVGHGPAWVYLAGPDSCDYDLYIRWNAAPTTGTYDCRGFSIWAQEICNARGSGTLYYMANSWYGSGEYTMLALIFPSFGDELRSVSGTLSGTGATYTFSVAPLSGTFTVVMVGNEQADFDLYAKWNSAPTRSSYDARGFWGYSSEYFTVTGSGTLYVMVDSWYGSGNFRCNVVTGTPATDGGRKVGTLSGGGSSATYSLAGIGRAWVYLAGPDSCDYDLYIRWNAAPTTGTYDCSSWSIWAQEICNARGSGTLYYMANSWYGSAEYSMLALIF